MLPVSLSTNRPSRHSDSAKRSSSSVSTCTQDVIWGQIWSAPPSSKSTLSRGMKQENEAKNNSRAAKTHNIRCKEKTKTENGVKTRPQTSLISPVKVQMRIPKASLDTHQYYVRVAHLNNDLNAQGWGEPWETERRRTNDSPPYIFKTPKLESQKWFSFSTEHLCIVIVKTTLKKYCSLQREQRSSKWQ